MKKILLSLILAGTLAMPALAATWSAVDRTPTVGKQILSKNNLPSTTKFVVTETAVTNSTSNTNDEIYVQKTDLGYTGNDNEVAAVIAQEIGVIINANASKKKLVSNITSAIAGNFVDTNLENTALVANELTLNNMSAKDQMNADITGVDLMIQAGYNPLAMIVVLGKMPGSTVDILKSQPNNFKRSMYIYDYLSYNYPSKVKAGYNCKEYKNFLAYIQPTIDERNSNKSKLAKFQKEQAKLKKERAKQIAKYKATGGLNGWDASYTILKNLSESSEN
ncbi:TPA: hypothetical protein CPT81_09160 [Candidatus Gastranaerophilales bacterium HUM_20]|jgi:hypothetical protein|nr:putative uncharacterized protein [Clostridium sp. CAG:729]DAB18763.1 MAG TPA: hypothetical protein CPT81_09160 [Candidatus Gastranaerophilales bacterium HUM_20]